MAKRQKKKQYLRVRGDSGQRRRILAVGTVLGLAAFVPLGARLYTLMVRDYDYYADLALRNQTRTTQVTGRRGDIYDRNMQLLACSVSVENVYLNPRELKQSGANLEEMAGEVAGILDADAGWVLKQAKDQTKRYKQIAARIDTQTATALRSYINRTGIAGIHLEPTTQRLYPSGSLAAQVIGFTNASGTGCEGIEATYNSYLEGAAGRVITTKGNNEIDMPYSYERYVTSTQGCSLVLTMDSTVQACLERQMENAVARYDVQNGAFGMVMDVNTGEILAMATLGSYDPNDYQQVFDEKTRRELLQLQGAYLAWPEGSPSYEQGKAAYERALQAARLRQWRNRCISDGYEPGSTFKVLTMAAALDSGAIDLNTAFYCKGAEQIPGRSQLLHCWRAAGHGAQQTPQALQNSCNLAFAHIALRLGGETFYEYVRQFGILEKTGIDLAGESKGIFFDKALVTDTDKWGTASLTSGSFGQTFKLTPLQLVRAIAAVVNGGTLVEPYIVSEAVDGSGNVVLRQEPTQLRRVIREETSQTMCSLLRSVVEEGTAKNAQVAGFSIGGKTGTSEKIDVLDENGQPVLDKIVSFVGVAPMEDPQYIVLVALDTPSRETGTYISGGVMAAPTVGAVMEEILPYLGVATNYTEQDAAGRRVQLPDLTGMTQKEAQAALKDLGLTGEFSGTQDRVTGQLPAAGQTIPGDSQVLVYCGTQDTPEPVQVPDFAGMHRQQASDAAGALGLYILASGNPEIAAHVKVTAQSVAPGTMIPAGSTIRLEFTDTYAAD